MSQRSSSLTSLALQKFKRNFWGVLSLGYILCCGLIALFAYVLAPDVSKNANQMHLSIHSKGPGFEVLMLTIPSDRINSQTPFSKWFFGESSELPRAACFW